MPTQRLHAWLDPATAVPGPSGQPRVIADEGVLLPVRTTVDMRGAGVTASDDAAGDRTVITIPGQTPWTGNVDAADHSLLDVTSIRYADGTVQTTAPSLSYGGVGRTDVLLPRRPIIRFSGDGVTATDNAIEQRTEIVIPGAAATDWADITGKPSSFPPDPHTHPWSEVTGKPLVFPPEAHQHPWTDLTGVPANVSGAVPNTTRVIAGTGLTGGGMLTGNVTLSANIAAIQSPWVANQDANGKFLSNVGKITLTNFNAAGADTYAPLVLDRTYGDVGDSHDFLWTHGASVNVARVQIITTGIGEFAYAFHAQTGSGDGANNEIFRILGNRTVYVGGSAAAAMTGARLHVKQADNTENGIQVSGTNTGAFLFLSADASAGRGRIGYWNAGSFGYLDITGQIRLADLPSASPGAGSKRLYYDPADGNRVKFAA